MTIPSRPAPAPPGSRAQNAAVGANASLEQLRLQLQQQQLQQQQSGAGTQRFAIKLPPPPKGPNNVLQQHRNNNNQNNQNNQNSQSSSGSNSSSITRKFPQARYSPATTWDDSPFETVGFTNGNFKKVPPPRPPPPKVQVNGRPLPPTGQSSNILTNIFSRKKNGKVNAASKNATRVYGVSSGNTTTSASSHTTTTHISTNSYTTSGSNVNWNAWNTTNSYATASSFSTMTSNTTANGPQEAQLISFDSPPSSPTFTQKSNSDCVSVDSFSSDSNFSSPNNGSVSQPESGFEDDFSAARSRPATTSPLDPWESLDAFGSDTTSYSSTSAIGTAPVRNMNTVNARILSSNDNPLCNGKSLLPPSASLNMPTIIKPKISQKPKAPKPPMFMRQFQNSGPVNDHSPPMPQCAPPPPPAAAVSLLDVISGKADAIHLSSAASYADAAIQPYGVALYDFDSAEEGDLSFKENDKIYLLDQVSAEWYRGRTRSGCEGIFPVNYIDIKVPLSEAANLASTDSSTATTPTYQSYSSNGFTMQTTTTHTNTNYTIHQVRCLYNFPAEVAGDLALKENDLVTILYRINEDWLYGEVEGRQGQFPANFLEYIPDNIPMP